MRIRWLACGGLACSVLCAGLAYGQERSRTETRTERQTTRSTTSTEVRRVSTVIGASVELRSGGSLGRIEDIILTPDGCLDYVVVAYENRLLPIPWVVADFDFGARVIRLDIDRARLREAVFIDRDFRNVTEVDFRTRVNKFFNVRADGERGRVNERVRERDSRDIRRDDRTRDRDRDIRRDDRTRERDSRDTRRDDRSTKDRGDSERRPADTPRKEEEKKKEEKKDKS